MKYLCFGYMAEGRWDAMTPSERDEMMETCLAYDDTLKAGGHWADGYALSSITEAVTLHWQNGTVAVTDGPYAETKEQLGGILVLEARDLNEAIQLMSRHPAVRICGPFEIRALDAEFQALVDSRAAAITGEA